jgi:hypothetical protein
VGVCKARRESGAGRAPGGICDIPTLTRDVPLIGFRRRICRIMSDVVSSLDNLGSPSALCARFAAVGECSGRVNFLPTPPDEYELRLHRFHGEACAGEPVRALRVAFG